MADVSKDALQISKQKRKRPSRSQGAKDESRGNSLVTDFKERVSNATKNSLLVLGGVVMIWINVFEHGIDLQMTAWSALRKAQAELDAAYAGKAKAEASRAEIENDAASLVKRAAGRYGGQSIPAVERSDSFSSEQLKKSVGQTQAASATEGSNESQVEAGIREQLRIQAADLELDHQKSEINSKQSAVSLARTALNECEGSAELLGMKLALPLSVIGPALTLIVLLWVACLHWERIRLWSLCEEIIDDEGKRKAKPPSNNASELRHRMAWWLAPAPLIGDDDDNKRTRILERVGWTHHHPLFWAIVALTAMLIGLLQYRIAMQGTYHDPKMMGLWDDALRYEASAIAQAAPPPMRSPWSILFMMLTWGLISLWVFPKLLNLATLAVGKFSVRWRAAILVLAVAGTALLIIAVPGAGMRPQQLLQKIVTGNPAWFLFTFASLIASLVLLELWLKVSMRTSKRRRLVLRLAVPVLVGGFAWAVKPEFWRLSKRPRFKLANQRIKRELNFVKTKLSAGWYRNLRKSDDAVGEAKTSIPHGIVYYVSNSGFLLCGDASRSPVNDDNLSPMGGGKASTAIPREFVQ